MPRLNIHSHGIVKGGHADYSLHSDGRIEYNAKVKLKWGWFSKTQHLSGTFHAGQDSVLSSSYDQVKEVHSIRGATCVVSDIQGPLSYCTVKSPDASGDLVLNITEKLISVVRVNLYARAMGKDLRIEAS